ncbi:hypothetical protein HUA78_35765 [Myxococcus sp. CA033]|uniref:Kelch repeat-containing protein n=1 Tax=Myxococcus sp. CA033 TaxID=2741516 RepID=UPI00157A814D|nr:kelch repeat-containing protein [Myxococcus sp. CA033]NTX39808.1 hypothetical protein [Myxococcus sp. CA033]
MNAFFQGRCLFPRGVAPTLLAAFVGLVGGLACDGEETRLSHEVGSPEASTDLTAVVSPMASEASLASLAPRWEATGSLSIDRHRAASVRLNSGKVLVAGGYSYNSSSNNYLASAELYDPATRTWSMAASMAVNRDGPVATLLANGKVFVVGGYTSTGRTATAEVYDPATNSWSAAGAMHTAQEDCTATLLTNGKVVVTGGYVSTPEVYDPATNTWSLAGAQSPTRLGSTSTLLPNGKVLHVGGWDGATHATARLYDPATNSWSATASMATARWDHTATRLPNGKVLVVGGWEDVAAAELYDSTTNTWSPAGTMSTPRAFHTAALVDGKVLVTGGHTSNNRNTRQSAELYDPATNTWSLTAPMATGRSWHSAITLVDGNMLVTNGGRTSELYTLSSAPMGRVAQGYTCGAADTFTPSCAYSVSPDATYAWTAPSTGLFTFTTAGSDFDTVLEIVDSTTSQSLGCNDEANSSTSQSSLTLSLVAGQKITVKVEGYSVHCGNYALNIQ